MATNERPIGARNRLDAPQMTARWVYGRRQGIYRIVDVMRHWTTHMSMSSLYRLTWVLNLMSYGAFCLPHRLLRAVPGLGSLARRVPFTRYAALPLRVGHADWFDRLGVPSTAWASSPTWRMRRGLFRVRAWPAPD